jgi:hypothetical protein
MAIQPTKLIIVFLAVAFICLAGWIMDFSKTVVTDVQGEVTELTAYMDNADDPGGAMESHIGRFKDEGGRTGVFSTLWHFGSAKFHTSLKELFAFRLLGVVANIADCIRAVGWALRYHFL